MIEFISVVHRPCIGLLELSALSLARNYSHVPWRVYVQDDSLDQVVAAMRPWSNIQVEACHRFNHHLGWFAQQFIKIWAVAQSSQPWTAIIGPGNSLIGTSPFFDHDGTPWVELTDPNKPLDFFTGFWHRAQRHWDTHAGRAPSVLTPWVWRTDLVKDALAQSRPLEQWHDMIGVEQYWYWARAHDRQAYKHRRLVQGFQAPVIKDPQWACDWVRRCTAPWWLTHRICLEHEPSVRASLAVLVQESALTTDEQDAWIANYLTTSR